MPDDPSQPLTPLTMAILLALAEEVQHGYGLMQAVEEQTEGALRPGTGSLYAALERLIAERLIMESAQRPSSREDRRRKYYRITAAGRRAAAAEVQRMAQVLEKARSVSIVWDGPAAGETA